MKILSHDRVTADGVTPQRWLYVLHGIYGAGRNWASVIRRVVRQRPEWGALLVDLRQHGGSQGFPEPHTVQAAAEDLEALASHTSVNPTAVLGHSFGGKVGMVFAAANGAAASNLRQVWVIDSTPDSPEPGGSAWKMLNMLRQLPHRFASRDELVDNLVSLGTDRGVAQWMATNLESRDDGYHWRFDFDAMESLLRSFYETDTWSLVEHPREGLEIHLVRAEQSTVLSGDALQRVERAVAQHERTHLHSVAGGHWVNAENPQAIEELLVRLLP